MQQENIREEFRSRFEGSNLDFNYKGDLEAVLSWFLSRTISKQDIEKFVEERGFIIKHHGAIDLDLGAVVKVEDLLTYIKNK